MSSRSDKSINPILAIGALLGLLSVVAGAMTEHLLADAEMLGSARTAVRLHQVGAILTTALGLALLFPLADRTARLLRLAAILFIAATALFSFSIYLAAALEWPGVTRLTPLGGVSFMAAWIVLAWAGLTAGARGRGD